MGALLKLLHYDRRKRLFDGRRALDEGLGCDSVESLALLVRQYASMITQGSEATLAREFAELLRFRAIILMLPEACVFGDPEEEKPQIREHLQALGVEPNEELVSALKVLCTNFRAKRDADKMGISDVIVRFPHIFRRMMAQQGGRCCYCGALLVFGEDATLDHVLPHHIGDDPYDGSNWRIACQACNRGKGALPYYSLNFAGVNWVTPADSAGLREAARFGALMRDKACDVCGATPLSAELCVVKAVESGCWVLDNLRVACRDHVKERANSKFDFGT